MESMLLKSIFKVFTTVHVRSLTPGSGVCEKPSREERNITIILLHCCNNFYPIDERCVECPTGFWSSGDNYTPCDDTRYGRKCANKCRCKSMERSKDNYKIDVYICEQRKRVLVAALKEIEVNADIVRQQQTEEMNESIYEEIDESGERLTP
ncbi:unnamed protein product [Mytilus edulis]|uniref:Uncharacterized protein n=1 Tax=Mytilus edulis TaxID=6550 RepID=A0A8S3QH23_MYTED|nr:unnamed protein product [Mytilus edulis]